MYLRIALPIVAAVTFACLAIPARGADWPSKIRLSPLHVIAMPAEDIGQVKTAMPGRVILKARLGFQRTASVVGVQNLDLAGLKLAIGPGDVFRAATLADDAFRLGVGASAYCSGNIEFAKEVRSPVNAYERGARFDSVTHVCLVDDTSDGRFEHGFIEGAKWPEDQRLFALEPFAYAVQEFAPSGKAELLVSYQEGALLQGPILSMSSNLLDGQYEMSSARIGQEPSKAPTIFAEMRVKGGVYPKTLQYGDAQVTIVGFDRKSRALSYRIDHGFETRPAIVSVIVNTILPNGWKTATYTFQ